MRTLCQKLYPHRSSADLLASLELCLVVCRAVVMEQTHARNKVKTRIHFTDTPQETLGHFATRSIKFVTCHYTQPDQIRGPCEQPSTLHHSQLYFLHCTMNWILMRYFGILQFRESKFRKRTTNANFLLFRTTFRRSNMFRNATYEFPRLPPADIPIADGSVLLNRPSGRGALSTETRNFISCEHTK